MDGSIVFDRLHQCAPFSHFLNSSRQSVVGHAWACSFHKNYPFAWGSRPHLIHGSLSPLERVHNPNGTSIGSAIFVWLTTVTDRPTDRLRYSVLNNDRIYVGQRSTAMRSNNAADAGDDGMRWILTQQHAVTVIWIVFRPALQTSLSGRGRCRKR